MHRNATLRPSAVVCSIAILCCPVIARAQLVDAFDPGANQIVNTIALQPDGKVVVGGNFTGLGGVTGTTVRNHIGRLNADGSVDPSFNPGTDGPVLAVAVQADGKILAGGNFFNVGGGTGGAGATTTARSHIARFNADGTVDTGFNPGANLNVWALAVQPDGKILVGGDFSILGGAGRIGLGRLNANGTPDAFNPGASKTPSGAVPIIYALALQADGKVVVGGYFNGLGDGTGATTRNFIGRLNADGSVDGPFNPGVTSISGVNALALQADGKILVGGTFTQLGGSNRANIGRVDANGVLDLAFNPGAETQVLTLGVQTDGKILAGGYFKWLGGAGVTGPLMLVRNYIGRLDADGIVDGTFNPGASNVVNAVALQADGGIVAGGIFDRLGNGGGVGIGTVRNRIGRLTNTGAAVQSLEITGGDSIVTWARGGTGPEVSRVTFESSATGAIYTLLGSGTRVAGGWQLSGLSLSANVRKIRARGYYETGQNGSGSIVELILSGGQLTNGDFDGDGKADITVYRPSNGTWFTFQTGTLTLSTVSFGVSGDVPVPRDYDGDGRTDVAVYRPVSGTWYIFGSSAGFSAVQFGASSDVPVPADYDGDGRADIAVYRPSTGSWYIRGSTAGFSSFSWGIGTDLPVPGDYDGDGKADIAVYRPSGTWFILESGTGAVSILSWGTGGDLPVVGDYDGDAKTDIAVYRPSTGTWYIRQSATLTASIHPWGTSTDVPVPTDYDGDGKTDIAVFRPSDGTWYILESNTLTFTATTWGSSTDIPVFKRP